MTLAPDRRPARIVCSGDSFTLGYGVDDEQTWCARLEAREPRFETINMGQGGYGIDQAYLWYRRDAAMLDHHVQVFAFISADFGRLLSDRFQGYGKPVLRMKQGALVLENTPVPRAAFALPWLAEHRAAFDELRSLALLRRGLAWRGHRESIHFVHVLGPLLRESRLRNEECAQRGSQSDETHVPDLSV